MREAKQSQLINKTNEVLENCVRKIEENDRLGFEPRNSFSSQKRVRDILLDNWNRNMNKKSNKKCNAAVVRV